MGRAIISMGEVTLTDVKYLSPVGVPDPLSLAFWADYVDPEYLEHFKPLAIGVAVFSFVWYFVMPYVHRRLEKKVQEYYAENYPEYPLCVAELGLVWPVIGVIGVLIAFYIAITADSRVCMLCAISADNVRGFGGGFCAYTEDLSDSLKQDNTSNCIFVKESLLGPGRRTWMKLESGSQLKVTTEQIERKYTGEKGVHTLWITARNDSDSEVVDLLHLEQNSTIVMTPFNETMDGLAAFADNKSEPIDFAGNLGWGFGKLYMRASRETVQLIVFRQDEMVCAFFGAMGIAILISVPMLEACEFEIRRGKVNRERYFLAPMSWMVPTNTGLAALFDIKYAWFECKKGASSGWLCLKVRASRSGNTTMDAHMREISSSYGEEEALRVQRFLYGSGVECELTPAEKESCEGDIEPPLLLEELRAQQQSPTDNRVRKRGKGAPR